MTPQEAIETIKVAIAEVEWNYPMNYAVAFEKAIEALKRHIPKKIISEEDFFALRYCPCCKVRLIAYGNKHCANCGQALDWSDCE